MCTKSAVQVDAAMGGIYDVIAEIIRACGANDSSGLRRCIADKLAKDPLIKAAPDLLIACKCAADLYDDLSLGPIDAAAKHGPDYELPTAEDCLKVRGLLEVVITEATQ